MANIFVLDSDTLKIKSFKCIDTAFSNDDFKIEHKSVWNSVRFNVFRDTNKGCDICNINGPYETKPHFHEGGEHRLFLRGQGMFYIPMNKELYCVECFAGDLIWLRPRLLHWFTTYGNMSAARFFLDSVDHTEMYDDIPLEIFELKEKIGQFNITI